MFKTLWFYAGLAGICLGLAVGSFSGWKVGYNRAAEKGIAVAKNLQGQLDSANGDVTRLKAANERYETAMAENLKSINAELQLNMARQVTAQRKNEVLSQGMLDVAAQTAENAAVAREAIRNALDECAHAGMSADTVRVLNSIRPGPAIGISANALSPAKADH